MIRLNKVHSAAGGFMQWCWSNLPLFMAARTYSSSPTDWFLLWMGWSFFTISVDVVKTNFVTKKKMKITINRQKSRAQDKMDKKNIFTKKDDRNPNIETKDSVTRQGLPNDVFIHVCSFLHPKDITTFACTNKIFLLQANNHLLWKYLWFRDYGNALLQWKVGREAFAYSLSQSFLSQEEVDRGSLKHALTKHLERFTSRNITQQKQYQAQLNIINSTKEFYFAFGEVYTDYVLAGRNSETECLLGLHGHIFDFTKFAKYHPGLIEPILQQCGGDVTDYFEDIPHSKSARDIARELCVLVNRACLLLPSSSSSSTSCNSSISNWGLYIPTTNKHLSSLLQNSNTIPVSTQLRQIRRRQKQELERLKNSNTIPTRSCDNNAEEQYNEQCILEKVLPHRVSPILKRPPTLERIRKKLDDRKKEIESQPRSFMGSNRSWNYGTARYQQSRVQSQEGWRIYFDPIQEKWMRWNSSDTTRADFRQKVHII